jgi:hypothetical protein
LCRKILHMTLEYCMRALFKLIKPLRRTANRMADKIIPLMNFRRWNFSLTTHYLY